MSVSDYNSDPDLNTTISGINIAEGCPPSGINNAIRQMMADVKDLDGDIVHKSGSETVSGAKTFSAKISDTSTGGASFEHAYPGGKTLRFGVGSGGVNRGIMDGDASSFCLVWGSDGEFTLRSIKADGSGISTGLVGYPADHATVANRNALKWNGTNVSLEGHTHAEYATLASPAFTGTPTAPTASAGTNTTQIATTAFVQGEGAAHLAKTETFTGSKTFSADVSIEKAQPVMNMKDTGLTQGTAPGSARSSGLYMQDSAGTSIGRINLYTRTNGGNGVYLRAYGFTTEASGKDATVWAETDASGNMSFHPDTSNTMQLGRSNARWSEVFANTGTINTSDERLKQDVGDYPDAVLDAWGDVEWKRFRFIDAVDAKGEAARYHSGLIAQRIKEAFEAHGLDAARYGFFCHDSWDEQQEERDENGEILSAAIEAGDMYSLRYEECLAIEAAYQRRRSDRIEARLAALEALLDADGK